jgi:hypothetical protein
MKHSGYTAYACSFLSGMLLSCNCHHLIHGENNCAFLPDYVPHSSAGTYILNYRASHLMFTGVKTSDHFTYCLLTWEFFPHKPFSNPVLHNILFMISLLFQYKVCFQYGISFELLLWWMFLLHSCTDGNNAYIFTQYWNWTVISYNSHWTELYSS